jgi:CubicO group peptidase (beta-lactamase class C family)
VSISLYCSIKSGELPGIVTIIADKDTVLQANAIGYADLETQQPMKSDTVFWIASQSKPVTAVAVMILVDEGKLSLTEPITKYLPELANLKVAVKEVNRTTLVPVDKPITLAMLLSHTAGCEFLTPFQNQHKIDSLPMSKYVATAVMTPLRSQPGTAYHYSNIGINLAGVAIPASVENAFAVTQATWRFFANERVTPSALIEPLRHSPTRPVGGSANPVGGFGLLRR